MTRAGSFVKPQVYTLGLSNRTSTPFLQSEPAGESTAFAERDVIQLIS
jgi:hypothetical protein